MRERVPIWRCWSWLPLYYRASSRGFWRSCASSPSVLSITKSISNNSTSYSTQWNTPPTIRNSSSCSISTKTSKNCTYWTSSTLPIRLCYRCNNWWWLNITTIRTIICLILAIYIISLSIYITLDIISIGIIISRIIVFLIIGTSLLYISLLCKYWCCERECEQWKQCEW